MITYLILENGYDISYKKSECESQEEWGSEYFYYSILKVVDDKP